MMAATYATILLVYENSQLRPVVCHRYIRYAIWICSTQPVGRRAAYHNKKAYQASAQRDFTCMLACLLPEDGCL